MTRLLKAIARFALGSIFLVTAAGAAAGVITKSPDQGPYWFPIAADGGTYIYANSFVAPDNGAVTSLGLWLRSPASSGAANNFVLDVFGSIGGNPASGPDSTNVIAQTGVVAGGVYDTLTFVSAATVSSLNLVAGNVYWFAINVVGQTGTGGGYEVGGHTQNSVYNDNGTFWYSNDPNGIFFDGQNLIPEMAFQVVTDQQARVPEPATWALLGLGVFGLAARRRKTLQA